MELSVDQGIAQPREINVSADQWQQRMQELAAQVLDKAVLSGASAAEVALSHGLGLVTTVRMREVETVEHIRDKSLILTVYFGDHSGSASTVDFSTEAVAGALQAACNIARFTAADPCNGLADADLMAHSQPDLELFHPRNISVEEALQQSMDCEAAALDHDSQIVNSEGASLQTHLGVGVYANSHGFVGPSRATRYSLSCAVVGTRSADAGAGMQRDYWYTSARCYDELQSATAVGRMAAQRTVRRLGARKLSTRQAAVLFEAPVASSLISHFLSAIRGGAQYRNASFLKDYLDKQVFSNWVHLYERPQLKRAMGSAAFDNEGVATRDRDLVSSGILRSYCLSSYSARKLTMPNTGHAGGPRNVILQPGNEDFQGLMRGMDHGLLVTELIGFGINGITGDYSRGAAGFWVEHGEIQYPVEEITIAGNLREIFQQLVAAGTDLDLRGNIRCGSILVENMTIAGA